MIFKFSQKIEKDILLITVKKRRNPFVFEAYKKEIESIPLSEDDDYISKQVKLIEENWNSVARDYYLKLGDFFGINISEPDIICYLTRFDVFPFKYKKNTISNDIWFSAPLFGNPAERNRVIMHELCHFFQPVDLPESIKEAIPVILNDHENFKMYGIDRGHQDEDEQKWRKIIWDLYLKGGKFSDLLNLVKKIKK